MRQLVGASGMGRGAFAALSLAVVVALSSVPVGYTAPAPEAPAGSPGTPGQRHAWSGPLSAAFQSSFAPTSLTLRPASCGPQPGVCVGRTPSAHGVLTLVSQYRGRGRGGGGRMQRPVTPQNKGPPMNDRIPFPEMRVVVANSNGKDDMLGVMSKDEALARAEDLVQGLPLRPPPPSRSLGACASRRPHARWRAQACPSALAHRRLGAGAPSFPASCPRG